MKNVTTPSPRPKRNLKVPIIALMVGLLVVAFLYIADWGSLSIWVLKLKIPLFKEAAVTYLNKAQDPRATDALIGSLTDSNDRVRETAATALGNIKDQKAVDPLIGRINDPNKEVSAAVIRALGKIGDERAIKPLEMALTELIQRNEGCEGGGIKPDDETRLKEVIIAIVKVYGNVNGEKYERQCNRLTDLDDEIFRHYSDPEDTFRHLGRVGELDEVQGLVRKQEQSLSIVLSAFTETLEDPDPSVRMVSVMCLAGINSSSVVEPLLSSINDENTTVRFFAVLGLIHKKEERAVPKLLLALNDAEPIVRLAAIYSLSTYQDPRIVQGLVEVIKESGKKMDALIETTRGMAETPMRPSPPSDLRDEPNEKIIKAAFRALALTDQPETVEALISLLANENETVRSMAALSLASHEDTRATDALLAVMTNQEEDTQVRISCINALARTRDEKSLDIILKLTSDGDTEIRKAAIESLRFRKDERALSVLLVTLKDKDKDIRRAAARALASYYDPRAVEALIKALKDPDSWVRSSARMSLIFITNQHFDENEVTKWQEWWKKNKSTYKGR
jgi:HEAT repeat protein